MGCGGSKSTEAVAVKEELHAGARNSRQNTFVGEQKTPSEPEVESVKAEAEPEKTEDEGVIPQKQLNSLFEEARRLHEAADKPASLQEGRGSRAGTAEHTTVDEDDSGINFNLSDFPTPEILKAANIRYGELHGRRYRKRNNKPLPIVKFKDEIFKPEDFKSIEERALRTPASFLDGPMLSLVEYLIETCTTELEKARVLFRWMSAQKVREIEKTRLVDDNTVYAWLQLIAAYNGFDVVFLELCILAGLEARKVRGYLRGTVSYEIGQTVKELPLGHWTAVRLDGSWRFVHAHWALHKVSERENEWLLLEDDGERVKGPLKKTKTGPQQDFFYLDEDNFLVDPHQFIYSHIPTDGEQWQLLARPVTNREFAEIAYLRPAFFNYGLKLKSHLRCEVEASNGECVLIFGLPEKFSCSFKNRLFLSSKDEKNLEGKSMENYVFVEQNKEQLKCRIVFPVKGKLKFELQCTDPTSRTWLHVCDFVIHCEAPNTTFEPLQEKTGDYWGPNEKARELQVEPVSHPDGVVETVNGLFQMKFTARKDLEITANLHNKDKKESQLKQLVVHQRKDNDVIITGKVEERGDNVLEITAKEKGQVVHISSYLLTGDHTPFDPIPYPKNVQRLVGGTEANEGLKVEPVSHPDGIIQCPEKGELEIVMKTQMSSVLKGSLEWSGSDTVENMDRYVFVQQEGKETRFKIRILKTGIYSLQIYGKRHEQGDFKNVFNYVIEASVPKPKCLPFPEPSPDWRNEYQLIQATNGILPTNTKLPVTVKIPGAEKVAVIGSSGKTSLSYVDGDTWRADVTTGRPGDDFRLAAAFSDEKDKKLKTILTYQIQDKETIDEEMEKQAEAMKEAVEKKEKEEQEVQNRQDEFNQVKDDILKAIEERDISLLKESIEKVESKRYIERLKNELNQAKKLLHSLEKIRRLKDLVTGMDGSQLTQLKEMTEPPRMVHDVIIATLMVLGEDENQAKDWEWCQNKMNDTGPDGLISKIDNYDVTTLHPEVAARAKDILGKYRLDDVRDTTAAAGVFYQWTLGMIEELYEVPEKKKKAEEYIDAKNDLIEATNKKDVDFLRKAIEYAEKNYPGKHQRELKKAKKYLALLEKIRNMQTRILDMSAPTMAEMRNYPTPQPEIHQVMVATLLLLGDHERKTRKWKRCQRLLNNLGKKSILRRVKKFDLFLLHPEIAARSKEILQQYEFDQVSDKSAGAATFYKWSRDMVTELVKEKPEAEEAPPADVKRQKEIFEEYQDQEDFSSDEQF